MHETIKIGDMSITYIHTRDETVDNYSLFEISLPPHVSIDVPHSHRDHDQTIFGLDGICTWTVDGHSTPVGSGESLFIPRGAEHFLTNLQDVPARMLCLETPGVVGPEYFHEIAACLNGTDVVDEERLHMLFKAYGVTATLTQKV
jgi:quercetin dioxygenase-like cupin family protein